jgi:phosphate transport system permease protein
MQPIPERVGMLAGAPRPSFRERLLPVLLQGNLADRVYALVLLVLGLSLPVLFGFIVFRLVSASWLSIQEFGLGFVVGSAWNPVTGQFGALPFIFGTIASSMIAVAIALPLSVGLAIFLTELAPRWLAAPIAFATELLAAIPSVVFGLWGIFVLVPWLRSSIQEPLSERFGDTIPFLAGPAYGVSIFSGGVILAIMIIPFISAVTREVLSAVPPAQREAALALGATRWEMTWQVVLPYAVTGISGAVMLGLGRALGETMAITMVIGNRPQIPGSLFHPGYSMASVLANEFKEAVGDLYLASLTNIGLILLVITIIVNSFARLLVWRVSRGKG